MAHDPDIPAARSSSEVDATEGPETAAAASPVTRRRFMLAGGGMLLGGVVEACTSEGIRSQRGAVRILVTGLSGSAPDGGSARMTHSRGRPVYTVQVPLAGEITIPADVGGYSVEYTAPTGFQVLSQATGPRAMEVSLDATTILPISVVAEASVGALSVTVTGLTGTGGGSAVAQRTDAPDTPRVIQISPAGTGGLTGVPVGIYSITYTAPPGFLDTSATNPSTGINVAAGGTASVSFSVAVAPGAIHVSITGIAGATGGGRVAAMRTDNSGSPLAVDLPEPVSGQTSGDIPAVPAGSYNVTYTPPGGYQLASPNPVGASVAAGGTANVAFIGAQIPGAIQVTVTGLSGAAGGGTVSAIRSDGGGSTFSVTLPPPSSGTSVGQLGGLPPGNYSVSYVPPTGYQLGSQSPQSASVTSGGSVSVAFAAIALDGTLRLVVEGLQAGVPDGGSAQVLRTDIPGQSAVVVAVPASGAVDRALAPGTYTVTYSAPAGYQLSAGQTNPRAVTIVGSQTAFATFQVAAAATVGTLRLMVTGLTASATSGGSAQVLRTDIPGQTALSVSVPGTGTVDTPLQPGTYSVTYTPPGGHRLVAGDTNPKSIAILASATGTVSFANEEIPPAVGILFHSDWSTGTGLGDAARRDTSKAVPWRNYAGNAVSGIETAASLGLANWPTANAYVVRTSQAAMGSMWSQLDVDTGLPAPGQHRYFRVYVALLWEDNHGDGSGIGGGEHGIESSDAGYHEGGGGGDGHNPMMLARADGTWNISFREIRTGERYTALNIALRKFTTYRLEWHIAYGTNNYTAEIRVFDAAGNQVADTTDFTRMNPFPQGAPMAGAVISLTSYQDHRWFRVGSNGPTTNYPSLNVDVNDAFRAHGAVAVSDTNWCGPYAGGV